MRARLRNELLSVEVDPLGAELASIRDAEGREYLWQGSDASWKSRSPVLFPVIGGLNDGRYVFAGNEYELPSHGFARGREWQLVSSDEETLRFRLESDPETLALYPFHFRFDIIYTLNANRLTLGYEIENRCSGEMLFSVGAHPGFNCPLLKESRFEDYRISFEKPEATVRHLKEGNLLSGRTEEFLLPDGLLPLTHELFSRGAIILRGLESSALLLEYAGGSGPSVRVEFDGFPDLGIWSYPHAPEDFVCIEPWFGVDSTVGDSGELKEKSGMINLAADGLFEAAFTIEISC